MTFNEDTYKQMQGTAMGKDHAPPYANLVIAYLVMEKLYPRLEKDYGKDVKAHVEENFKLYLDDGFMILDETKLTADEFLRRLNDMDSRIKFTMETSNEEIPFLDVLIKMTPNVYDASLKMFECDIYHKPTDAFNYFNFESCAPGHIPRNVPYNLARRIATIVSRDTWRKKRLEQLRPGLRNKGYPESLIEDAITKAMTLKREDLINSTRTRKKEKQLTLVIDYYPNYEDPASKIKEICNQTLPMTDKGKAGKLPNTKIIAARRQPPNLERILSLNQTRDHTISKNNKDGSFTKCKDTRCKLCTLNVIPDKKYTTKNGTTLERRTNMSCKTKDLIYVLICPTCKEEYIGETGIQLSSRMNLHRSQMTNPNYGILNVSRHLNDCGNNNFLVFPFIKCNKNCHIYREETEKHWRDIVQPGLH